MKQYHYHINSKKRIPKDLQYERAKLMYQYRTQQNMTLNEIAQLFGLGSRERARQIINEYQKKLQTLDKQKNTSIMDDRTVEGK